METNCLNALLDVGECLNVPEEMAQELQTVKMVSRGTRHELKQENRSRDGVADTESMEALAKEVELMQHHNGNDIGNQERSNNCRTKRGVEKVAIELLAKRFLALFLYLLVIVHSKQMPLLVESEIFKVLCFKVSINSHYVAVFRAFTGAELRKKLAAKNFPVDDVEAVLHDFRNRSVIPRLPSFMLCLHYPCKSENYSTLYLKYEVAYKLLNLICIMKKDYQASINSTF